MKRIDFLGAPGVGKSTLYKELLRQRKKPDKFLTPEEAKVEVAKKHLIENKNIKKHFLKSLILNCSIFRKKHCCLAEKILKNEKNEVLWKNKEKYNEVLKIALRGSNIEEKIPYRRFLGLSWFFDVFQKVLFLEENFDDFVIYDESLSQKIYGLIFSENKEYEDSIVDYFRNCPKPFCVIFCRINKKGIFKRIKQREKTGKIIPGHRDVNNKKLEEIIVNQIEVSEIALKVLKERGIHVLEIDMANDIKKNAKEINIFLKDKINEKNN